MAEDYYKVLGVEKRPRRRKSKKPTESWPSSGIRIKIPTTKRQPRRNSKKSARLTLF